MAKKYVCWYLIKVEFKLSSVIPSSPATIRWYLIKVEFK